MTTSNPVANDSTPPAAKKSNTSRILLIGCGALIVITLLCLCGIAAFGFYLENRIQQAYEKGRAAFDLGDCAAAASFYAEIVESSSLTHQDLIENARQENSECQEMLRIGALSQPGAAILAYRDFTLQYSGSGQVSFAIQKANDAFSQAGPQAVASEAGFCDRLTELLESDMIPDRQTSLEKLYPTCGQFYETQAQYEQAAAAYDAFLQEFPDHPGTEAIKAMLAHVIIEAARASGAGEIPAPQVSGSTGAGTTLVIIQNDSPESLRIVFSGPEARIEELGPCEACESYTLVGPSECPDLGPVGSYTLKPGVYEVVVESGSGSDVTPWTGTWELADGDEYSSCFFVVTTP